MNEINRLCIALLATLLPTLAAQSVRASEAAPLPGFNAYVREAMHAWGVPGLAVAVVKDGNVVMAKGFGVKTLGKPAKVNKNTLFAIASNTKAFTAASLGMLVDAGKLKWNSPVAEHLKNFKLHDPYPTREVRIRDLLTHRTGYCGNSFLWYDTKNTRAEILHKLRLIKPQYSFRTHFCYSNIMLMAAGQIIPAITGKSWSEFVETRIFAPLGMRHSITKIAELPSNAATPYAELGDKLRPVRWYYQKNIAPAGAIISSVNDMTHWLQTLLAEGEYHGHRILSPAVVQEMETPQIVIPASAPNLLLHRLNPEIHSLSYGLALFMADYRGEHIIWHTGHIDGMSSALGLIPGRHLGVVILCNRNQSWLPLALVYRIIDRYLGAPKQNWSARILATTKKLEARTAKQQAKLEPARATHPHATVPLAEYAGVYTDPLYGKASVTVKNGHLLVKRGRLFVGDMQLWNHDTFKVEWRYQLLGKTYAQFLLDPSGHVEKLKLAGFGNYTRKP